MIRRLRQNVRYLITAVLLLAALACAAEVALRVARSRGSRVAQGTISMPSAHCYLELRPILDRTDPETGRSFRTSSFGTRGDEPAVPKPAGVLRLLVLGDEATLAADQPASLTFCSRLQTLLTERTGQAVEVVNAGLPGGCPLTASLQFRHRLTVLQPDAVLLVLDAGDIADDIRLRPNVRTGADGTAIACPHPAAATTSQSLQSELILVDLLMRSVAARWLSSTPAVRSDLLCPTRRHEWSRDPVAWAVQLTDALLPIETLAADVRATGATFHLTAIPTAESLETGVNPWLVVGQFALAKQIDWLDPGPGLSRHSQAANALYVAPDSCDRTLLTPVGHELLALDIARHLTTP